ncbi:CPBP family intramembrane metalloprotease [Bacillus clarus]|uniref:CAAX protease self-immunity family protein n=1 Tax=Bacillus clarus TaxID=2338372 RepID=A0A090YVY6_9BACI|nr:type II CAAX endopeptidase family protein [Bacillus clarus]KFN02083.1 CAAX protease self-immunity family protein [Bacillus clarus]RFT62712.1 CPBP family intramembrane metalloprotease [Bacillus clarus]
MTNLHKQNIISWKQFILGILVISFFLPIILGIPIKLVFSSNTIKQSFNNSSLEILKNFSWDLAMLSVTLYVILKYKPFYNLILSTLNIKPLYRGKTYLYILIAIISTSLLADATFLISNEYANIQATDLGIDTLSEQSFTIYAIAIISIVLLGPIFEEILYRGIILRFLEIRYSFFTGLIISSLLFGLAHDYDLAFIIFATLSGIIDGLLYKKTNSIIPVLIGHMTYNLYTFI